MAVGGGGTLCTSIPSKEACAQGLPRPSSTHQSPSLQIVASLLPACLAVSPSWVCWRTTEPTAPQHCPSYRKNSRDPTTGLPSPLPSLLPHCLPPPQHPLFQLGFSNWEEVEAFPGSSFEIRRQEVSSFVQSTSSQALPWIQTKENLGDH